ncbi:DNA topoisomerase II medium subunit [Salmonella phage vB_SenM-AKM_NP4]|uniref:DNA topoisomerase (ATP-hydrolyzing) n=2 Tax=Gelderlandvirus TaxID=1913653 RepID=M1EBB4_BPS16|nr:DNA topoisomerase II [Salmonella phage vB_SenM-S16]YP_009147985.1 DNA topoisomerase II [Salmonella phage STML-198]WDR21922.1 DNA topoisomerase [Salmonella phage vB_SenM_UTK0003]WLI71879.1 DNA topoisomerase II medium subunit [Salmonella phage vB_SenM-AKM_NP4]AEO97178.1 DNA topisomerase II medium subunit [Salmonella phage vB_SenM-S16]AFU63943.1 DNA topoisomerase [Salmonella phage STML-198]
MQLNERSLQSIIDTEAKEFAIYTVENRAIPNMIDGFKPVQRFVIRRALDLSKGNKEKFHKLASVAGGVADLGYHHGEGSAQDAGALMANTWNNNFPLLDGQGNFGSRLVQKAAASRYIFCRISDNFRKVYKDLEIAPKHKDEEHTPPAFYLPVIPTVLLNGVRGIATGYATNILPHSFKSVVECTKLALQGKLDKEPEVEFPKFNGKIVPTDDGGVELHGVYKFTSATQMYISEIPYKFDRDTYIEKVLDPLEDKGFITYTDDCSKSGFGFKVKFKKDYGLPADEDKRHDAVMRDFKLIEKLSQFIVVIDENGKLNDKFQKASELIKHFVEVRKTFVEKRIEFKREDVLSQLNLAVAKAQFIKQVISGEIVIQGKTRKQLVTELEKTELFKAHIDKLVGMNIYHITSDEAKKLVEAAKELKKEYQYWKDTTPEVEFMKDLEELCE